MGELGIEGQNVSFVRLFHIILEIFATDQSVHCHEENHDPTPQGTPSGIRSMNKDLLVTITALVVLGNRLHKSSQL